MSAARPRPHKAALTAWVLIVSDCDDEAAVIAVAFDTLHRAMKAWGSITENRRIAARDVDELAGD